MRDLGEGGCPVNICVRFEICSEIKPCWKDYIREINGDSTIELFVVTTDVWLEDTLIHTQAFIWDNMIIQTL